MSCSPRRHQVVAHADLLAHLDGCRAVAQFAISAYVDDRRTSEAGAVVAAIDRLRNTLLAGGVRTSDAKPVCVLSPLLPATEAAAEKLEAAGYVVVLAFDVAHVRIVTPAIVLDNEEDGGISRKSFPTPSADLAPIGG